MLERCLIIIFKYISLSISLFFNFLTLIIKYSNNRQMIRIVTFNSIYMDYFHILLNKYKIGSSTKWCCGGGIIWKFITFLMSNIFKFWIFNIKIKITNNNIWIIFCDFINLIYCSFLKTL